MATASANIMCFKSALQETHTVHNPITSKSTCGITTDGNQRRKVLWVFQIVQSQTDNFIWHTVALGAVPRQAVLSLTTQARRSLKDYTAGCQRGVQSSGLRNERIRVQGLGVLCPTQDKTATRCINLRGGCVHTASAEMQGHTRRFIYFTISCEGLHHKSREQQENNALPLFVNICSEQLSMQ